MVQVILTVTEGPDAGTVIAIRRGQVVQVGRTAWADFSVPGDTLMSDVHFAVEYDMQGCRVRDLSGAAGTLVNGAKTTTSPLRTGDEIGAGQSVFSVRVEGESEAGVYGPAAESHDNSQLAPASQAVPPATAASYTQHIELGEDAEALLQEQQSPAEFLDLLIGAECFSDATKFLAVWLPKPNAVGWAGQCLRDVFGDGLSAREQDAVQAAVHWASEPSEENRQAAGAAGEAAGNDRAAGLLGLAAFVSEGSLAPPDLAPVPPPEGLTAQCIAGALAMAVYHSEPGLAESRYRKFLKAGRELAAQPAGE